MSKISRGLLYLAFVLIFNFNQSFHAFAAGNEHSIKTEIFKFNPKIKKIEYSSDKVLDFLNMKFISVTTDQPEYWPDEDVYLKIIMPMAPSREVKITFQKKDSISKELGKFKLDDGGILVQKIMSGTESRLEPGEYTVIVERTDKNIQDFTTFSVIEGSLSSVSFAYEFKQMTDFDALKDVRGGWFLGNAGGAGMRWGNMLFVKNQLREFNEPFSGKATVKTRCYLPGCNGCEAGPPEDIDISNGSLEVGLDIRSHSGPFEIEMTTPKGSVRHMFQKSGHIERQSTKLTHNMTNNFFATLAPYEGTSQVYGRDVFIEKSMNKNENDAFELTSPVCDESNKIEILARKDVVNARAMVFYFGDDCELKTREIVLSKKIKKGKKIELECFPPYSFVALAGCAADRLDCFESWAIVFAQSRISVEITAPETGMPLSSIDIDLKCTDMRSGRGMPCRGILEVFDNRVESKSPKEPLVSAIGDSYRSLSDYTSNWVDLTGYGDGYNISNNLNIERNNTDINKSGRGIFSDVPKNHWSYKAIDKFLHKSSSAYYDTQKLKKGKLMTRYEMALAITRLINNKSGGADLNILQKLAVEFANELTLLGVNVHTLEEEVKTGNVVDALKSDVEMLKKGGIGKFKISLEDRIRFEENNKNLNAGSSNIGNSRFVNRLRMNIKGQLDDNVSTHISLKDSTVHGRGARKSVVSGTGAAYSTNRDLYLGYVDIKNSGDGKIADSAKQGSHTLTVGKAFVMDDKTGGVAANNNYRGSSFNVDHEWKAVSAGAYYMERNSNAANSDLTMGKFDTRINGRRNADTQNSDKRNFEARNSEKNNDDMLPEMIRTGEKKVVYCGAVVTDKNGRARLSVQLPPQMGRCKIRFVALDKFDYLEKNKDIDVNKDIYVETSVPAFIIPGSHIIAKAHVAGRPGEKKNLKLSGACLEKEVSIEMPEGKKDFEFELVGKNYGALHMEIFDNSGKLIDRRDVNIKNSASANITYSNIVISNGSPINFKKGENVQIYSNPGTMLRGLVRNIVTTMYSWFAHAEAITAQAAIRATLLRAIDEKIIDDDGMRDILKSGLVKSIRDFTEKFYDEKSGLVHPYPDVPVDITWTIWSAKNLISVVNSLKGSERLKNEFSDVILATSAMAEKMISELLRRGVSIHELGMFDPKTGEDVIPVEIDGKVVYQALIDDAAIRWFVDKIIPELDLPNSKGTKNVLTAFNKCYDKYRFMRAFERTGPLYYILVNLKPLFIRNDKNFAPLFAVVARGLINTSEPGLIQGPALLGGVYSSPQTAVKFIELLILMAGEKKIRTDATVEVFKNGGIKETIQLSDSPLTFEATDGGLTVKAPEFSAMRSDEIAEVDLFGHLEKPAFFKAEFDRDQMNIGDEGIFNIQLEKGKDPSEYYAIIAVPSTLSIRQTDDLLSDYKGQLLYGQKSSGGAGMQLLTAPFRGSSTMTLHVEGARKGESVGFVTVRHIFNPEVIATVKTVKVTVK